MKTFDLPGGGVNSVSFTKEQVEEAKKLDLKNVRFVEEKVGTYNGVPFYAFGCGCTAEDATGLPISTCRRHDQRTREVKASAALMQMANCLDEAGKAHIIEGPQDSKLREAARYAVKAAKALIGASDEG